MLGGAVDFEVPAEQAFDYLVEPRNRPEWQSSLSRIEQVTGDPRVGQRWVDVTKGGLRPQMETTALDRPECWSERGAWHGVVATLTLFFDPRGEGCEVTFRFRVGGRGLLGPLGLGLTAVSVLAVRNDLRRAADILLHGQDS